MSTTPFAVTSTLDVDRPVETGFYEIDPGHSRIGFVARHAMVTKVHGTFDEFSGSGRFDADSPASSQLELTIQASSIQTRNTDRDNHLRTSDFLDVARFPTLNFRSTSIEQLDPYHHRVTGDLDLRGVTKPVVIDFEVSGMAVDPDGAERIGFEGTTVIDRKDWGVNWNASLDAGGVLVGNKITLEFDVSAIRVADS